MTRRVLFLHHGTAVSGAEKSMLALAANLDRARYEPLVLLPEPGRFEEMLRAEGIDVALLALPQATLRRPGLLLQGARRLRDLLERCRIDVVHANSFHSIKQARPATMLAGLPLVGSIRDMIPFTRLTLAAIVSCDRVACVSEATRRHVAASVAERHHRRLRVIYNGVDAESLARLPGPREARAALGLEESSCVHVGLLAPYVSWKGHGVLLDAVKTLVERGIELRVVLAGDASFSGPHYFEGIRRRAAEPPLAGTVHPLPFVSRGELLLASLDIVVCASVEPDPLPRAVIEAMAAGLPVVGSDIGGVGEAVEHGKSGLLFTPGDAPGLADALQALIADRPLRERMGGRGRELAEERFSIALHCARFADLYDEVIAERRERVPPPRRGRQDEPA